MRYSERAGRSGQNSGSATPPISEAAADGAITIEGDLNAAAKLTAAFESGGLPTQLFGAHPRVERPSRAPARSRYQV